MKRLLVGLVALVLVFGGVGHVEGAWIFFGGYNIDSRGIIWRANLDGFNVETLLTGLVGIPRQMTVDVAAEKIYWANTAGGDGSIVRSNLDGTDLEYVVTGLSHPFGVALDIAGNKVYWTDTYIGKIQRANLDGSGVEDILTGLAYPRQLALDVGDRKVYWTESNAGVVRRANLNGAALENVATGITQPHGIALDLVDNKVYWIDIKDGEIERANLDGTNRELLVSESSWPDSPKSLALDVDAGKMYWTENDKVRRATLDGLGIEDVVAISGGRTITGITFVPEPSTPILLAMGGISLFGYAWRRRERFTKSTVFP